jgi:hypothetical protein
LGAFFSGLLSLEKGIIGNFKLLLLKPRYVVENYWYGYRKYLYSPGQMVFYSLLVIGLHASLVDSYILGIDLEIDIREDFWKVFISPQLLFILFLIPLYTLTTYIVFFAKKHSFLEHFIAGTYNFSFVAILSTFLGDLLYYLGWANLTFSAIIFSVFLFIWSTRVFAADKKWFLQLGLIILQYLLFIGTLAGIALAMVGTENIQWD